MANPSYLVGTPEFREVENRMKRVFAASGREVLNMTTLRNSIEHSGINDATLYQKIRLIAVMKPQFEHVKATECIPAHVKYLGEKPGKELIPDVIEI